jgi:exopolyphosphatase/guanosine-5'-triphosphate,3'-diphosphate pyrophosphatase
MNDNNNDTPRMIAAVDLGSNSFHMVVAKVIGHDLQLVSRHKQRVRLADGLNKHHILSEEAIDRGLECLAMFAERIQGFSPENVRIAATHTLRQALNTSQFIEQASEVLPYPIEVIPGTEEARLIYLGVAHTQPQSDSMLVIDIGGGSTEMIIGHGFQASLVNSIQMGCVSFTNKYFSEGTISQKQINQAILGAEQKLERVGSLYRYKGWQASFGASGTIKAVKDVLIGMDFSDGIITPERLDALLDKLKEFNTITDIELKGLNIERQPVFIAGVTILKAIFNSLRIKELDFSDGALREGLLYEMEDRLQFDDIRLRTTETLAEKYSVDLEHAAHVKGVAKELFNQISEPEKLNQKQQQLAELLEWSALLHEVGQSINFQSFHKHSAYILTHTNMAGFNSEQQLVLATLARFHRKALKLQEMPSFTLYKKKQITQLIRILRLAVILNGQRNDEIELDFKLEIENDTWRLSTSNPNWLEENRLLHADLQTEQEYWQSASWELVF